MLVVAKDLFRRALVENGERVDPAKDFLEAFGLVVLDFEWHV